MKTNVVAGGVQPNSILTDSSLPETLFRYSAEELGSSRKTSH